MMFRRYRTNCICKSILKIVLFIMAIWLICKLVNFKWSDETQYSNFVKF